MKRVKQSLCIFLAVLALFTTVLPTQAAARAQSVGDPVVIVIDPGHGGENLGTIENGFLEKEMTLKTAQAMYEELCLYDNVQVYMTRTVDVDLSLKERAEFAASVNADFLFSLHYNASLNHTWFGSEIWISAMPPYNAYGYQFGYLFLQEMQNLGLHLRGIKTRLNDEKTDYYGVIREATALSVPAVIIEHCHVDEKHDYVLCNSDEELAAMGKADALAVAEYFGLKSTQLGVDYSGENLPQVDKNQKVKSTLWDETTPDICMIEVKDKKYIGDGQNVEVTLNITATDYDTPLIYFDFSQDGGLTYSPLQPWPESNVFDGSYKESFELTLNIPAGQTADIIVRAYNLFDGNTESNKIHLVLPTISKEHTEPEIEQAVTDTVPIDKKEEKKKPGTTTFMPTFMEEVQEGDGELSFLSFLKLCLILVIILFFVILVSQTLSYRRRKKRRRQRMKDMGNDKYQPR